MAAAPSRNPFLSPQATGTSSAHVPASPGPSIHSAFADLSLGLEQPPLTPQHTAASTTSNNPFLDRPLLPSAATRPQQAASSSAPGRPLSAQELAELEGTAVTVTERESGPPPAVMASATSQPAEWPGSLPPAVVSSAAPAAPAAAPSDHRPLAETRRVAEGNEDFRGTHVRCPARCCGHAAGSWHLGTLTTSSRSLRFPSTTSADDDEALEAAIQASLAEAGISAQPIAGPSSSSTQAAAPPPPLPARTKAETYAPPLGPPPIQAVRPPSPSPSLPPADPPPAYTPASQTAESTIDAGPRVPDFARRPIQPLEPQRTGWSDGGGNPGGFLEPGDPGYRPLGASPAPSHSPLQSPYPQGQHQPPQHYTPPPPPLPHRPQQQHSYGSSSGHQPSHAPFDPTPSSVPIIGRPFLNNGLTLVYPAGFQCYKCLNSGCVTRGLPPPVGLLTHSLFGPAGGRRMIRRTRAGPAGKSTAGPTHRPTLSRGTRHRRRFSARSVHSIDRCIPRARHRGRARRASTDRSSGRRPSAASSTSRATPGSEAGSVTPAEARASKSASLRTTRAASAVASGACSSPDEPCMRCDDAGR